MCYFAFARTANKCVHYSGAVQEMFIRERERERDEISSVQINNYTVQSLIILVISTINNSTLNLSDVVAYHLNFGYLSYP